MEDSETRKLIKLYRESEDSSVLDCIVKNHLNACKKVARLRSSQFFNFDERVSIGYEYMIQAILEKYNLESSAKFVTHLMQKIPYVIIDEERKYSRNRQEDGSFFYPIVRPEVEPDLEAIIFSDKETCVDNDVERKILFDIIEDEISKLPRTLQIIVGCVYYGMQLKEIAEQVGLTVSRISQLNTKGMNLLRKNLRRRLNGEVDGIKTLSI